MGNGSAKLIHCFSGDARRRHVAAAVTSEPYDEGLGHSFCYIRPDALAVASTASSKVHHSEETTTFRTISGASVSANTATSLSTALAELACPPAAFESSTSFSSVPLQPVPRFSSGPLSGPLAPADRGFLSGPIERGFMSGPHDHRAAFFSGPLTALPLPASPGATPTGPSRCPLLWPPRLRSLRPSPPEQLPWDHHAPPSSLAPSTAIPPAASYGAAPTGPPRRPLLRPP